MLTDSERLTQAAYALRHMMGNHVYDPAMPVMDAFVYARHRVEAHATKKHAVICGPMIMNITPERHGATNAAFTVVVSMRLERAT